MGMPAGPDPSAEAAGRVGDSPLAAAKALARTLFDRLRADTADAPGVTRVAYGPGEAQAYALMAEAASDWQAERAHDDAGNQYLTLPGADRTRRIVIGSHLDSVPHGGNYDGAAGVILGLCLQRALVDAGITLPFDLTVACLRAEESCWFPHSYIGSKTALGRLEDGVLDRVVRSDTGLSLAHHIDAEGFSAKGVREGRAFLTHRNTVAYIEPHIEQAPLLLDEGLPVAAVTGIRGSFRYREMRCFGEYSHSGAMPRLARRDTAVASARLIAAMQDHWDAVEEAGGDLTVTFGQLSTDPEQHSFSKVAGEMRLCLDVRSQDPSMLAQTEAKLKELCETIAAQTGTRFDLGPRSGSDPAAMSSHLVEMAANAARARNLPVRAMASGAGHDAATFAQAGIPSLMLFIRNSNGSHNPDEHMEMEDFDAALELAFEMFRSSDDQWTTR